MLFVVSLALSCEHENIGLPEEVVEEEANHSIPGTWLFVEYGYSPGDVYNIVPVPADPPQTITFNGDLTMSATSMGLEKYKFYRLLEDTVVNRQVIAFFEKDPGDEALELSGLSPSYNTFWNRNHLNLNYRWCIEGCHMKFRRISPSDPQ